MKVFELFKKIKKQDFLRVYPSFMPENVDIEEQWKLFREIRRLKPKIDSSGILEISLYDDKLMPKILEPHLFVRFKKNGKQYSTSFMELTRYLGYEFTYKNLSKVASNPRISNIRIACTLFYDATFYGYSDEEIKECEQQLLEIHKNALKRINQSKTRKVKK